MENNEVAVDDAVVVDEGCACNIGMCVDNADDADDADDVDHDDGDSDASG